MTEHKFIGWLQKYLDHNYDKVLNERQVNLIRRTLLTVCETDTDDILDKKPIDRAIEGLEEEYEDEIELYETFGGD